MTLSRLELSKCVTRFDEVTYGRVYNCFTDMYGISEDDRGKAERCIESTIEYIKNYCHIDSIPDDLKHTVILMAADLFRYDVSSSSGQYDNVTSIKEGDVTVSYGSNSSSMSSVFKDYKARLARFRKLVW